MTNAEQHQSQVRNLIDCYLAELERKGRAAPLPLQALASLPEPARTEATFTLRLLRACWNAGPDRAGSGAGGPHRRRWEHRRA